MRIEMEIWTDPIRMRGNRIGSVEIEGTPTLVAKARIAVEKACEEHNSEIEKDPYAARWYVL